jgi:hypothetical protein
MGTEGEVAAHRIAFIAGSAPNATAAQESGGVWGDESKGAGFPKLAPLLSLEFSLFCAGHHFAIHQSEIRCLRVCRLV